MVRVPSGLRVFVAHIGADNGNPGGSGPALILYSLGKEARYGRERI